MSLVTLWRCLPRGWTNGLRHGAAGTTSTASEEREDGQHAAELGPGNDHERRIISTHSVGRRQALAPTASAAAHPTLAQATGLAPYMCML